MKSFANWVMSFKKERSPFGDVARDVCEDSNIKRKWPYKTFYAYLVNYPACEDCLEVVREMRDVYRELKKQEKASKLASLQQA
jgi:hypothetical protein